MFLGERNAAMQGSGLASVYNNNNDNTRHNGPASAMGQHGQLTPPDDFPIADETAMGRRGFGAGVRGSVLGWLEIWDYAGGSSFRAFVAEDASRGTKSLFVFFDAHSITRELKKQAYVFPLSSLPPTHHLDHWLTNSQTRRSHRAGRGAP